MPAEVVYRAGLSVGDILGRAEARAFRGELRRQQALAVAVSALRRHTRTRSGLDAVLGCRGVTRADRERTLDTLTRAHIVDDRLFAAERAHLLARRGCGDLLIADDLERHGVLATDAQAAIRALEPEAVRAEALVQQRGLSAQTLRRLAAKGFDEDSLEPLVAKLEADT